MATTEAPLGSAEEAHRPYLSARRLRSADLSKRDRLLRAGLAVAAVLPGLALLFLAYKLVSSAWPAIRFNGFSFLTTKGFDLGNENALKPIYRHGYEALPGAHFGVLSLLFGTVVCSVIALIVAVPVSVGGVLLLVERLPARLQDPLSVFLELLAGIPSVIYGLWGYFTFGPFLTRSLAPALSWVTGKLHIPWLHGTVGHGSGLFTAGLVLAVMIIPIIASTTRELVRGVPALTREGAAALGLTSSESVRIVTLPFVRTGIVAASLLGWARALGETIAVLIISGNNIGAIPKSIYDTFATMAGAIAATLDAAIGTDPTGMAVSALAQVGVALLIITLVTNLGGRLLVRRLSGTALPVGRGI